MPSLKALRKRIRTVENTKQITRAMKTVAASKMRRTEERLRAGRPYARTLQEIIARLVKTTAEVSHPFLTERPVKKILLVTVTADRGLCGAFNSNVIRRTEEFLLENGPDRTDLYCIGKKGRDYFRRHGGNIVAQHIDLGGKLDVARIRGIADDLVRRFLEGEADEVYLVYNTFISTEAMLLPVSVGVARRETVFEMMLFVMHNTSPVLRGAGSCVFLHVWAKPESPTQGCVAMSRESLQRILPWLDLERRPVLVQLPEHEYRRFEKDWSLPTLDPEDSG